VTLTWIGTGVAVGSGIVESVDTNTGAAAATEDGSGLSQAANNKTAIVAKTTTFPILTSVPPFISCDCT
jgi:hypothetical protein